MSNIFNIDIHCHPSTKPFMSSEPKKNAVESFAHQVESKLLKLFKKLIERKSEVLMATQSSFDCLFEGGHKVVIAGITPMERGFLLADKNIGPGIKNNLIFATKTGFEDTIKPPFINALMGFSIRRIEDVRGAESFKDYFEQGLQAEYRYLINHHQNKSQKHGYTIKFVKTFDELAAGITADEISGEKNLYVLISIEGGHSFKSIAPNLGELKSTQSKFYSDAELNSMTGSHDIQANIRHMKTNWEFPPVYVTLMHHFWNGMGGHARSLNKTVGEILNQQEGINQPLTAVGRLAIRTLLEKQFPDPDTGNTVQTPRILVDVKHMSVSSRREYYQILDTDFAGQNIPVICSHTGIADEIATFAELEGVDDKAEEENDTNYFHKAQINLCGDDIRRIVKSKGLIGIQLDEKRIAGCGLVKHVFRAGLNNNDLMHECAKNIMANLFVAVKAVNSIEAWDVFCIGSDYDGLINYLDPFPTSARVSVLRDEIEFFLDNLESIDNSAAYGFKMDKAEMTRLMMGQSAQTITRKIFFDNVMRFLSVNFRR